jgi:hypothetical protein
MHHILARLRFRSISTKESIRKRLTHGRRIASQCAERANYRAAFQLDASNSSRFRFQPIDRPSKLDASSSACARLTSRCKCRG